jgi:ferrochelatase
MPHYRGQADDRHESPAATGVLLVNLGTPEAPTASAVRRYLAEFLSDPRVVEYPRWLWWLVLHGVILRVRPRRSAALYRKIWTPDGSPLATGTAELAGALQAALARQQPDPVLVRHAMRYGAPSIAAVLREMASAGVHRLLVLPLFPQYSGTTTASAFDAITAELSGWRRVPALRFIADYHAEPVYIEALAKSVQAHWQRHGRAAKLVFSFHGIPERYVDAGDPYFLQCQETARRLRERLGLGESDAIVSFQSRVGRERWLAPYTDETLVALARKGVERVQVLCPGFAVDCLETLEEIAITNRERFLAAGGADLEYIPALNAGRAHVAALCDLTLRHVRGWFGFESNDDVVRGIADVAACGRHDRLRDARG